MSVEIIDFLKKHLKSIQENDVKTYCETAAEDLTLYEWWIAPHRIDGLPFHEFMMSSNAERGAVFGSAAEGKATVRYDLSNLRVQEYGETAIVSYTLLTSAATTDGVTVVSHNESRVIVKLDGAWKVVHVHKSPAWQAPHTAA